VAGTAIDVLASAMAAAIAVFLNITNTPFC